MWMLGVKGIQFRKWLGLLLDGLGVRIISIGRRGVIAVLGLPGVVMSRL